MSEQEQVINTNTTKQKICIGLDIGTMNIVCAKSNSSDIKVMRNVFLPLKEDEISISDLTEISYVKSEEDDLFIIGQDAFKFSNIFGQEVSRPMKRGLISPDEVDAIDILTMMLKDVIGDIANQDIYCTYSIPAEAIDANRSVTYHERVFGSILDSLGINHSSLNESMAIIYSETQNEKFSGIGLSFGAGMMNCAISFKGVEATKFSTERSGDWIDRNVAESLNMVANRVTNIKEKYLDLVGGAVHQNKKIRRVLEALNYYYQAMIDYTIKQIIHEFEENVDLDIEDENIPIIVSGGTSLPNGFLEIFKERLLQHNLPFEISEIRRAKNPLTAVANGLMIKTLASVPK